MGIWEYGNMGIWEYGNMGIWEYGNMMGFGGGIMMVLFWAAVIIFVVWVVQEFKEKNSRPDVKALDILKERYAKGEITKDQFESMKKDIS